MLVPVLFKQMLYLYPALALDNALVLANSHYTLAWSFLLHYFNSHPRVGGDFQLIYRNADFFISTHTPA